MSRNSAFRFKNNQTDTQAIASQLGVESLVTGDIKQLGDKLVINVRLIDPSDDSQIWGNQYVKSSGDIIAAQNEIAQAVAQNLRLKLTNSEQRQLGKNYTENAEAYQLYLRARFHFFKITPPEIRKAIDLYQQAIDVDPNYALAYAGMADAYRTQAIAAYAPLKEVCPQAKALAMRALEIDESLADAHIVLGWIGFLYIGIGKMPKDILNMPLNLPRIMQTLIALSRIFCQIRNDMRKPSQKANEPENSTRFHLSPTYWKGNFCFTPDATRKQLPDCKKRSTSNRIFGLRTTTWRGFIFIKAL